jgi:hypothetical protein
MARPLSTVVADKATPLKFGQLNRGERKKITTQATDLHKFRDQRNRWESTATTKKPVQPLAESKGAMTPPSERRESAPPSVARKGPATPPTVSTPTDRKGPVAASPGRPSGFVSPRELKVTKPETVKIPKPPIVGPAAGSSKREAGPPPKPAEERRSTRDSKNQAANKNTEKDKNK